MTMTRRAFLLATGASGLMPHAFGKVPAEPAQAARIWVIDQDLPGGGALARSALTHGARVEPLFGDAGWLWFERLSSARAIVGMTRGADAFILTQFGAQSGMRSTQRAWRAGAVLWTLGPG